MKKISKVGLAVVLLSMVSGLVVVLVGGVLSLIVAIGNKALRLKH